MKRPSLFVPALLCLFLASCMQLGINLSHKTPRRAAKIPSFTVRDSMRGSNNDYRAAFDVKHYRINLSFDAKKRSISGFVATRFRLLNATRYIQLDLEKNLIIDSIISAGRKLQYSRLHTAMFITLPSSDSLQTVTVYYHGKPRKARRPPWEGGFVWKKDDQKKPFAGVACEGEGASIWLPIKSYLGDEPDSITCAFTCTASLMVVSNGQLKRVTDYGTTKTYHWQTTYPINPYNITFYLGAYESFSEPFYSTGGDTVRVSYYVLPENKTTAQVHFEQVKRVLKIYEDLFGPYPWPLDGFRLVESPYAGMEHQTAIAYGNGYKNDMFGTADHIIVHEAAHEWWGNAVSVADFADVWIHEGFATYAEALFMEQMHDYPYYLRYMDYIMLQVMNRKPLVGPRGVYYWNYKDGDVYMKGAAVLHTLRNEFGNDSLFMEMLRTFFTRYKYGIATTTDFTRHATEMSGRDLDAFFRQYLFRRESPLLEWWLSEENGKTGIRYRLKRTVPELELRIKVIAGTREFFVNAGTSERFTAFEQSDAGDLRINTAHSYLEIKKNQ